METWYQQSQKNEMQPCFKVSVDHITAFQTNSCMLSIVSMLYINWMIAEKNFIILFKKNDISIEETI